MKYVLTLMAVAVCLFSCKNDYQEQSEMPVATTKSNGRELSEFYCASCHLYPEPDLLDKATWEEFMLPRMGYMFGIYQNSEDREELFENNRGGEIVRASNLFPSTPQIDSLDWASIQQYYLAHAPDTLPTPLVKSIPKDLDHFKVRIPQQKMQVPSTTLVQFAEDGSLFHGDAMTKSFSTFSTDLELLATGNVQEGAVSIRNTKEAYWLTVMGSFSPTDAPLGMMVRVPKTEGEMGSVPISGLQRPVHSGYGDLDADGDEDIVVAEFGKWTGALSLHLNEGGKYTKRVLRPTPGAIKAYVQDMNNDGHLDIVALFAQGDEGVDIYYNDGKANFTQDRVLRFHPSTGSSFMNLVDYNNDGHMDIILAAGDNADYRPVMKPWHGVYVYQNDGQNQFEEVLFLHLNGAYNAVAEDFDLDGDIDVAAISFFPDWVNSPEESFVFFENDGTGNYSLSTFEQVNHGRWVVMDASDYDKDGDLDLVLGSLAFEVYPKLGLVEKWIQDGIPFIVLENTRY